jgi:uncharacterized protein (DUF2147 family)
MEAQMKKIIVIAALALVSTSAHANVHEVKFGGRTARMEIPANCKKISCIRINEKSKPGSRRSRTATGTDLAAKTAGVVAAPVAEAAATAAPAAAQTPAPAKVDAPAKPQNTDERTATARLTLPSAAAAQTRTAAASAAPAAASEPAKAEASPIGLWLTQKKEATIRVEECGKNLCGHVEGKRQTKVLINMRPTQANRWNGTIHDIRRGSNYSAHISLKGPNALRVTGCAFGGLFCGGETWTRVE